MKSIYDFKLQQLVEAMQNPPADPGMAGQPPPQPAGPQPGEGGPQDQGGDVTQVLMAAWQQAAQNGQANAKALLDFVKQARQMLQQPTEQPPQGAEGPPPGQPQGPPQGPPPGQTQPF